MWEASLVLPDIIGFLAAIMTVSAFACRRMLPLRAAAIAANLLFITYAAMLGLMPILALHCLLLPLNILHFATCWRELARGADRIPLRTNALR